MNNKQPRPPRICFVISTFFPFVGGGETHARLLCRELCRLGVDVFVVTRRTGRDLDVDETVDGIPVHRVPPVGFRRTGKYLMLLPVFLALLRRRRDYDMIVVSGLRLLGIPALLAARLVGKTCILRAASCGELSGAFIWDSPHLRRQPRARRLFKALIDLRNRLLLKADGFLGISAAIGQEYQACGVPAERMAIINNGTDTETFTPVSADERGRLKQKLGLPAGRLAAYTGKLNRGKGLDFLLSVWREFAPAHPGAHLVLVGSGKGSFLSCEEALRRFVDEHGMARTVTFTGYVKNVHEYLQCADLFVFPSENESLSNALIEALACGVPCLASDIGGIPDTVRDGVNGCLLPPGDAKAWLAALDRAWVEPDLAKTWGRQGREQILQRNSMRSVASRHLDFFTACHERRMIGT
jgi:glycosyltransferase involved in cell wall biosynthesis